jgi:hypothetical protein
LYQERNKLPQAFYKESNNERIPFEIKLKQKKSKTYKAFYHHIQKKIWYSSPKYLSTKYTIEAQKQGISTSALA